MATETIYGDMVLSSSESDLISRVLLSHGEWGYVETQLLSHVIDSDTVVYDVGAYIGTFSLGISKYAPKKIVAIEANRESCDRLRINLNSNCQVPYVVENVAVGFQPGKAVLLEYDAENLGGISVREYDSGRDDESSVIEVLALQQLRQRYGNYGLLKLDIEGAEYDALRGDAVWVRDNKPTIWAECNESPGAQQLLQFYLWAELSPHYIAFPAFRRNNFKQCSEDPYPIAYEASLLGGDKELVFDFISKLNSPEIIVRKIESFEDLRKALWATPRWGMKEWLELSRAELIALLGHAVKSDSYLDFLKVDSESST